MLSLNMQILICSASFGGVCVVWGHSASCDAQWTCNQSWFADIAFQILEFPQPFVITFENLFVCGKEGQVSNFYYQTISRRFPSISYIIPNPPSPNSLGRGRSIFNTFFISTFILRLGARGERESNIFESRNDPKLYNWGSGPDGWG